MATKRSRPRQLSRGATEELLTILANILPNPNNPAEMAGLGVRRRNRVIELHNFVWDVWADTHPEEGPFK